MKFVFKYLDGLRRRYYKIIVLLGGVKIGVF